MHENHRLWRMLTLLTAAEKKRFISSIHPAKTALDRVVEAVFRRSLQADEAPDAMTVWGEVFPDKPFKNSYFKNLESDMVKLIERFLVQLHLEKHPSEADRILQRELLERNCPAELQNSLLVNARRRANLEDTDELFMQRAFSLIAVELAQQRQDRRKKLKRLPQLDLHLDAERAVTAEYLLVRLRLSCDFHAASQASPHAYKREGLPFFHLLDALAALGPLPTLLHCYALCEQLLRTGEGYPDFKRLLLLHKLPKGDWFQLVIHAQNYCVQQSNLGKPKYLEEYLDWMDFRDQHQLLLYRGEIAVHELKNMITACIKLDQVPRGRAYLQRYIHVVPGQMRGYFETLNAAHLYFAEGEFKKAKRLLLGDPALDQFDDLDWRTLLLKLLVENLDEDWAALEDFVRAFQVFLRRCKSLPQARLRPHKAKLAIVEAILKAQTRQRLDAIERRIMEQALPDQAWLLNFCHIQRRRMP